MVVLHSSIFATHALILFFIFTATNHGVQSLSGPHIADVNILLPPKMTHPVEYRLLATDGCFKWSWDHHDILSVVPEYNETNHCSTSARLRSIAPYNGRKETAIYAADVHTGMVVRCKVYIDMFTRIQIFHSSVKLDLDGLATLRVRAFDSEENVFSSLVGLRFVWQLMPESDGSPHHLVHVPLNDSPLSDCSGYCGDLEIQTKLEESGVYSDLLVVKGTEIGHGAVSVRLLDTEYGNMTDKIYLTVAEAMSLDPPSPVLVLVGAALPYSLKVLRGNIPLVVPLPSQFHRWSSSNSSIAQVDSMTGVVHAINLGETSIIVEDIRVAGHVQISSLNVVMPDRMYLFLSPISKSGVPLEGTKSLVSNGRWYVVIGRHYLVEMKVFSRGPIARVIYTTPNEDVKLDYYEPEYWRNFSVQDITAAKYRWGNSRMLEPTSQGLGKLSASLTYYISYPERKEVMNIVQEVMVCDQVRSVDKGGSTSLSSLLLPWSPDVYQEAELHAVGGCAKTPFEYKWLSSDGSILSVSAMGVIQAKRPGKTFVKVVSVYDSLNFDEVIIEVAIPSSMVMMPNFPAETVVQSNLQAAVAMKTSNGDYFHRCDAFHLYIKWSTGSNSFVIINTTMEAFDKNQLKKVDSSNLDHHAACSWISAYAASPGQAILHATFSKHADSGFNKQIVLKASASITSFLPLTVHQAGDGNKFGGYWFDLGKVGNNNENGNLDELFLVPGAFLDAILVGGPKRWGKGVDFVETVDILDEWSTVNNRGVVHQVPIMEEDVYRIACQEPGNYTVVFKRGNLIGDDHPQPVVAKANLQLNCIFPSSIVVLADEPVNKLAVIQNAILAERGAGRLRSTPVTVANGRTIRVSAVGISMSGKAFANSSSVPLQWELHNCEDLAYWEDTHDRGIPTVGWERYLGLKNTSGECVVRAALQTTIISGYPSLPETVLTDAISLQVVSTMQVFPEFCLLFFNPNAEMNLSVLGGSCLLDAIVNDSRVVEVMLPVPDLQCSQLTLVPKSVGSAIVTVYDVGLSPPLTAASVVKVADVDWLKIISGDLISLREGNTISIVLLAGTDDGNTFDSSQYTYMDIHLHFEDKFIEVVDNQNLSNGDGHVSASNFTIYGRYSGVTSLFVTAKQQSGLEIKSPTIKVEVYSSPVVHPSYIFLVPGASYVVTVEGGPQIAAFIEYTSMNGSTVAVQKSFGRLSAISPGTARIVASFYGNGHTLLCQAHGEVKVGIPSTAILNVQSEQLCVGCDMPIFPFLSEGDLFSFYELCKNYKWTIEDEKVLSFHPVEDMNYNYRLPLSGHDGYQDEHDINFIKVLYGRSGGRSNVALSFSCDFPSPSSFSESRSYNTLVSILVVPDPPLAQGIPITWILPPHYTSSNLLPAYSGSYSKRDFQSQEGTVSYSLLGCCGRGDDKMQKGIVSIFGNKIKTTESNNLACIQAKDHRTGRIEVASCVRVAEVAQIRFIRKSVMHVLNLAVGAEVELPVHYYDNLGSPFHEAHNMVPFNIESNYRDVLALDTASQDHARIVVKAVRHGRALVGVKMNGKVEKSDYIMISVGAHIHPQNPVLLPGSYVNFSVEGKDGLDSQAMGLWSSANESVVYVDSSSGRASAFGVGTTSVAFQSSTLKLQTTAEVIIGDIIYVDAPKYTLTNVLVPPEGYMFPVKFSVQKFGARSKNIEVPYDCHVEPSFVGYTIPLRDLNTGESNCHFFPHNPEYLANFAPKSAYKRQDISVSIHAKLREAHEVSGSATALFVGGFSILNMYKDSLQLNLTPDSNRSILTVLGNTDVGVHWLHRDVLLVRNLFKEGYGIASRSNYEVKVLKSKTFREKLIFTLPANGQRVEIDIHYVTADTKATFLVLTLGKGVMGCFVLLIMTFIIYKGFLDRPVRSQPSTTPAPNDQAPRTPECNSPTLANEQSPRTPQPFMEYVRRTIDETPYYRREGRRFDPQNTY